MRKRHAVSALALMLMLSACSGSNADKAANDTTQEQTETTTAEYETHELVANAETITAYGQLLNNACVYLNENYADKITGDVRKEYDKTCQKLHNINLQGISAFAAMSDRERNEIFSQLEEIEKSIFDSVAKEIGVRAELTEAVTTTADKKTDKKASSEVITATQNEATTAAEESERITAAD